MRLPPHSASSEQGVLGCILISPGECAHQCIAKLEADSFYDLRHQTIWVEIVACVTAAMPIDLVTFQQRLKDLGLLDQVGGITYLNELQDSVPSIANLTYYLDVLLEKHQLRRLLSTTTKIASKIYGFEGTAEELFDECERDIAKAGSIKSDRLVDGKQSVVLLTRDLERRMECRESGKRSGLETGWVGLNHLTDGLQLGEQCVVGARPSMGKTAIATNLVEHICLKNKIPTAFVTLEMRPEALLRRMLSSQCRISMKDLRDGNLSEGDMVKIAGFAGLVSKSPLHFVNGVGGMNDAQVCSELRRLHRKHGIQFAVVDYLQKVRGSSKQEKKTYEVGSVSSALNSVAKELNIALVTLAQLNRENEKDKGRMPRLADLGDSKQIEQDADMIALLHRDRGNEPSIPTKLMIAKQRDGEIGSVDLAFIGNYCRFENAQKISDEDVP